ncbi:OmpA family protein [Abyssalbus ytuae]|uniref:OmpA family protein n=1 Tax=Abyssalbus ytuae TaxID=2926907 RepID=A0A9E7CYQ4_9FLAO|nr:OmpA family protein [Abyssalbus ytuae]UOB16885.1 OmpA family protein [Abyssalbus ytuae]
MKKKLLLSVIAGFIFTHTLVLSQEKQLDKAEDNYNMYAFAKAIDIYEKVAEKGYESAEMCKNLGNSYYFNADLENAGKWYEKLFKIDKDVETEYYFRYSHCLKAAGNYKAADRMMQKFIELTGDDSRAILYNKTPDYLDLIKLQSGRYTISNLNFNSKYSDFAPSFYKGNLVFSSARDTGMFAKNRHDWDNKYFLDIYTGNISSNGIVKDIHGFSDKVNTKLHESTTAFTKDGTTMYFTRNNYLNGNRKKDDKGITKLKIFRATLNSEGNWVNVEELPFNSDNYSVAHPALSPDETKLYFASDMPGTKGMSDIFVVNINMDGTFGNPENLGEKINTEGRETFPYVSQTNNLYFSSDGRPGLGGLDIFVTRLLSPTVTGEVYNVGEPVNSYSDDFTFVIDDSTGAGYFASNRNGGVGGDDIYYIEQKAPLVTGCKKIIKGFVIDKHSKKPLANAKVIYIDTNNEEENLMVTDSFGTFNFEINCNRPAFIRAIKKDYLTNEVKVDTSLTTLPIELEKEVVVATIGDDLGKILDLKPIYFDFDKWEIKKDAILELEKVIAALNKYPSLKIDVRSHTDSRADDKYNLELSEKRAEATVEYIVKQGGIDRNRITGKGYGETRLINNCSNGVNCSTQQHQLNRRSEFIILN